jgi:hypothetical protein
MKNRECKTKQVKPSESVNVNELTLLGAVERVVEMAENSALSEQFFNNARPYVSFIAERLQITDVQAVLLAVAASFYGDWSYLSEFASYFSCRRLQMLRYVDDYAVLRKRRLLRMNNHHDKECYQISKEAIQAIRQNRVPPQPKISGLTIIEFFDCINNLVCQRKDDEIDYPEFVEDVKELMRQNMALPFVSQLKSYDLNDRDLTLFLWGCNMLIAEDDTTIMSMDYENLYSGCRRYIREMNNAIRTQKSPLFEKGLMRLKNSDGMGHPDAVELTPYVRNEMLQGMCVEVKGKSSRNIIAHNTIKAKELFYNPSEERKLKQLRSLLEPEQFDTICTRLEQKGLRRGFACLFYGAPGTGKTETVLQLARATGRDLMQVNISEVKSMWVGESEKNVKAIFDRYRKAVSESERAPILFFNEADAIISKRTENVARAVDKMENALQNIILQEIENLEGVLIATTNLTKNMDSAFERRFLYKIEFEKPSVEAKRSIWLSMLPSLSNDDAAMLAASYDFSGGQIENISRKQAVEEILTGCTADINRIIEFCDEERLDSKPHYKSIGF